jgi:hypothetical protein
MNRNSLKYKKLEEKWYKRLKISGFDDLEQGPGKQDLLLRAKTGDPRQMLSKQARASADGHDQKQEYYRLAGHFLYEYEFPFTVEQKVWELHSQGISMRDIATRVSSKGKFLTVYRVFKIVSALAKQMMKMYAIQK